MKNTLRWLAVFPLGFLAMTAVTIMMRISNLLNGPFEQNSELIITFFGFAANSYVCGISAPAHKVKTAIATVLLYLIIYTWIFVTSFMSVETLLIDLVSLAGGIVGVLILYMNEK